MKTSEFVHARLMHRIPSADTRRPLNAVELVLCEIIDDMKTTISKLQGKIRNLQGDDE